MNKLFFGICLLFFSFLAQAQDSTKHVIQFSGIVAQGDSLYGVPGAFVFVPNTSRGANTSLIGYFSLPVLPGDSLVIAAIGFKKQHFIIPSIDSASYQVVIRLVKDTITLPLVELHAFPSEEVFKKVFLAMNISNQDLDNARDNLNSQILERLMVHSDISETETFKYYLNEQAHAIESRYMVNNISLLDPFAWSRFFKDLKEYRKKKK